MATRAASNVDFCTRAHGVTAKACGLYGEPHLLCTTAKAAARERCDDGEILGETFGPAYDKLAGWPTDSSLVGPHQTPCDLEVFKQSLSADDGYYYDPLSSGSGWCRKLSSDKITAIRAAHASGEWTGTWTAGAVFLPADKTLYVSYQGWPTDSSLVGPAVTPCDWRVFKAGLADGEGYFFDGLSDGKGWCRKLLSDKVTTIRAAHASGEWAGPPSVTSGTCYLPVDPSDFSSTCPDEYPHKASDKLCSRSSSDTLSSLSYCVLFPYINDYKAELQELRATVCGDAGAAARCSNVLDGRPGVLDCEPKTDVCAVGGEGRNYCDSQCADTCATAFASPVSCPDGIGPRGIFVTYTAGHGDEDHCSTWDSKFASKGHLSCNTFADGRTLCTKFATVHVHRMSTSAGMLAVKRVHCTSSGTCFVHKVGRCVDVGENVFGTIYNDINDNLPSETVVFGAKAMESMRSHATGACSQDDQWWLTRALQAW